MRIAADNLTLDSRYVDAKNKYDRCVIERAQAQENFQKAYDEFLKIQREREIFYEERKISIPPPPQTK